MAPGEFEINCRWAEAIVGPIISSDASTPSPRQLLRTNAPLSKGLLTYWTRNVIAGKFKDSLGLTINDASSRCQVPCLAWFDAT